MIGAVCLGAWPEAAMVMVLYEIGEAIEDMSMTRARNAIRKLMDVAPAEVTVKVGESWQRMKAEAVPAGSLYRIEPGERAALDGMVEDGTGSMDESMITGESMPAAKRSVLVSLRAPWRLRAHLPCAPRPRPPIR